MALLKQFTSLVTALLLYSLVGAQQTSTVSELFQTRQDSLIIADYSASVQAEEQYYVAGSLIRSGQYERAKWLLESINNDQWMLEAQFLLMRIHFFQKNYLASLELGQSIIDSNPSADVLQRAKDEIQLVTQYIRPSEAYELYIHTHSLALKTVLLESLMYYIPYSTAQRAYSELLTLYDQESKNTPLALSRIERQLSNPVQYRSRYSSQRQSVAPHGHHYRIGVLLPVFDAQDPRYDIVREIYQGIFWSVESFNSNTSDSKAFLFFENSMDSNSVTSTEETQLHYAHEQFTKLVLEHQVDVIIGPLFSNEAPYYSVLAEEYGIPLFLPLANADSLDLHNNFTFQINPSFSGQGAQMARFAVEELGFDTLGVLAEKGTLGAPAAHSFIRTAERLGAFVAYDFIENLEVNGYGITDYTQYFSTDTLDSVTIIDAVYAPFTGTIAQTLIESLVTDLEAMQSTIDILGSEEWGGASINTQRLPYTSIHYTQGFSVDTSASEIKAFSDQYEQRFGTPPNNFSFIGYDAGDYILQNLYKIKNPTSLVGYLKERSPYRGKAFMIDFRNSHINRRSFIRTIPAVNDKNELRE